MPPRTVNCTPTLQSGKAPSKAFSVNTTHAFGMSTLPFTVNSNSTSVGLMSGVKEVQMPVHGAFAAPPISCRHIFASLGLDGYFTSVAEIKPFLISLPLSSCSEGPSSQRSCQSSPNFSTYSKSISLTTTPSTRASGASVGAVGAAVFAASTARRLSADLRDVGLLLASSSWLLDGRVASSRSMTAISSKPGSTCGKAFSAVAWDISTRRTI
mmetsp:Transcript_47181/g.110251  ORF Transcript_47181/g.110251 Transcript_47181/m.110251 type:complete len:212 (-) Transcript_47181:415-1050(-)